PNRQVGDLSLQPTRGVVPSARIPQPAGWGIFHSSLQEAVFQVCESPNRQVGDLSLQPTRGVVPSARIPQPAGWESFIPAYMRRRSKRANPPPAGWGSFTPAYEASFQARESPNRQ